MRLVPTRATRSNRPFQGTGASLYIGSGSPDPGPASIAYRNLRAWPIAGRFSALGGSKIGGTNTLKTARVASVADPTAAFAYALPGSLASKTVYAQVRTFKDDVENETTLSPARVDLDGALADASTIDGTAILLSQVLNDGGIVTLRFKYQIALTGVQPLLFRIHRTAGPSSPADVTASFAAGQTVYEIQTPALLDSSPYTYQITAENGATVVVLLSGISIQADATGPTAATAGSAIPW
jgi:hypothetical protein